jgi:hypothetical protein
MDHHGGKQLAERTSLGVAETTVEVPLIVNASHGCVCDLIGWTRSATP